VGREKEIDGNARRNGEPGGLIGQRKPHTSGQGKGEKECRLDISLRRRGSTYLLRRVSKKGRNMSALGKAWKVAERGSPGLKNKKAATALKGKYVNKSAGSAERHLIERNPE